MAAFEKSCVPQNITNNLILMILRGELKAGDRLPPQRELAKELSVSRSALREAVKTLETLGLVESRHGQGSVVCKPDVASIFRSISPVLMLSGREVTELLELRLILETYCAELAAVRGTEDDLERIRKAFDEMKVNVGNYDIFAKADLDFHMAVADAAHNGVISMVINLIRHFLFALQTRTSRLPGTDNTLAWHRRIYDALIKREGEVARDAMYGHIYETWQNWVAHGHEIDGVDRIEMPGKPVSYDPPDDPPDSTGCRGS